MANPQPTVQFPPWGTIYPDVKPLLSFQQLHVQDQRMIAGDPESGYTQDPENAPLSNAETAMERARRIVAFEGYLDDRHFNEVMGAKGTEAASTTAARRLFASVQSDVLGQMYGAGSWLLKHVRGKTCTIGLQILVHNLTIQSRIYEFPVYGETVDEAAIRMAKSAACLQAARDYEARWTQTYQDSIAQVANEVEQSTGEARRIACEQLAFLHEIANDPPRCEVVDLGTLATADAARAVLKPIFHELPATDRLRVRGFAGTRTTPDRPARRPHLTLSHIASVRVPAQRALNLRQSSSSDSECTYPSRRPRSPSQ